MARDKKRLYIALYPSAVTGNEERRYHWGFLIGPKNESSDVVPGTRYHVKNPVVGGWMYEEKPLDNVRNTHNLLGRMLVAKITDEQRLIQIMRSTPVTQNDPNWRCRTWMADVLANLAADGRAVGTSQLSWAEIESQARDYIGRKTAAGRYATSELLQKPKPTWDMLEGRETVP
ncbi:hypothetical protein F4778DRAFT_492355 [Xylariomycetidae sp. FL2044]|nr:hypothetical protein F4778DRAFT_492355 [Xylariomycetidae sp. FL2044]